MQDRVSVFEDKGIRVYRPSDTLAFAITPSRAIFITPSSTCDILYTQLNAAATYNRLRRNIEAGKYTSLCDFITDMRLKPGVGVSYRQMYNWEIERLKND